MLHVQLNDEDYNKVLFTIIINLQVQYFMHDTSECLMTANLALDFQAAEARIFTIKENTVKET